MQANDNGKLDQYAGSWLPSRKLTLYDRHPHDYAWAGESGDDDEAENTDLDEPDERLPS